MLTPLLFLALALRAAALPAHVYVRDTPTFEGSAILIPSTGASPTAVADSGVYDAVHTEIIVLIVVLAAIVLGVVVGAGIYFVRRRRSTTTTATAETPTPTLTRTRSDGSARTLVATLDKDDKSVHSVS